MRDERTETISLKVSPEEKAYIKGLAEKEDTSVSKILYKIVFPKEAKKDEQ